MRVPILLDNTPERGDWIKLGTWEMQQRTPAALYGWLAQTGMSVEHFKTLNVYKVNSVRMPWLATISQAAMDEAVSPANTVTGG